LKCTARVSHTMVAKMNVMKLRLLAVCVSLASACLAADAPPKASDVLPGRPDARVMTDDTGLGAEFRSLAAGIAFRPPAGGREIRRAVGGDDIVQFIYDQQQWQLKATRLVISKRAPLVTDTEKDKDGIIRQGMLDLTAEQLKADTGGAEILRQDFINIGDTPVGMIAARYNTGNQTRLTQRAIVQADERLYYLIDFTTPAPRTGKIEDDVQARQAVGLFGKVVESVRLLDQSQLIRDQNDRLFMTKAFYVNLTEPKMTAVLVPQRWLRIIHDGKDIGYSYVVEEVASGLPRHKKDGQDTAPPVQTSNVSGIRVGVRSRTYPQPGMQIDAQSWSWVAMDHKQEEWHSLVVIENASAADAKLKRSSSAESGVAIWRIKPVKDDLVQDKDNRGIRLSDEYKLSITTASSTSGNAEPIDRDLPPFYLPRTVDHLLPRLLPLREPKGFMFASYVSDQKEIIRRYFDVGKEGEYSLAGATIHAIPVTDHVGLEGSVTTHYVSPEGQYLGSVNDDSKITMVPSDAATLVKLWKDANLTPPAEVEQPVIKPGPAAN
jgi:hypothetical protein